MYFRPKSETYIKLIGGKTERRGDNKYTIALVLLIIFILHAKKIFQIPV